jgi:hypothetical protein
LNGAVWISGTGFDFVAMTEEKPEMKKARPKPGLLY